MEVIAGDPGGSSLELEGNHTYPDSDPEGVLSGTDNHTNSDNEQQVLQSRCDIVPGAEPPGHNTAMDKIIIITPIATEEEKSKFVGRSIMISNLLKDSPFATAGIVDVRTNFHKKRISIQIKKSEDMNRLLKITKLGEYNIECTQPSSHTEWKGVIGPIGIYTTEDEILTALKENNHNNITKVIRLNKGKEKQPSLSLKLIFNEPNIPEFVYINYQRFNVRPYKEKPLQCYKCQRYGHTSSNCNGQERCVVCAGNHRLQDCPKQEVCCANCGQQHTASFSGCQKAKEAVQVEQLRSSCRITYREAVLMNQNQQPAAVVPMPSTSGYKHAAKNWINEGKNTIVNMKKNITTCEVACQTTPTREEGTQYQETDQSMNRAPDEKFHAFIVECFNSMQRAPKMNERQQRELISTLSKEMYGTDTNNDKVAEHRKKNNKQKRSDDDISGSQQNSQVKKKRNK